MADVYRVGVNLMLNNNVSAGLRNIISQLGLANVAVNTLNANLGRMKLAMAGAGSIVGGAVMLEGMKKLVEHGNELVKVQQNMAQAGATATQVQEAYNKSWEMTRKYQNMSAVEILKMTNDARMTFGDQDTATHHIEDFVKMASFLKAYQGGKHAGNSEALLREINAAMKSGEIAGKISPQEMGEHVKQLTAMKVAYGEQVKISQYLTAQRAAGVALRNSGDDFRYGMFPALVQENGVNAGTMLMTAFNKIVAATGNRTKSLEHMREIGLLKEDQIEYDKVGRAKGLKDPSGIMNNHEAAINFGDWVMKTFKPLLDAKTHDPIRQAQMISSMFPDRNAAKAITEIIQQYQKLAKDAEQMKLARANMDKGDAYTDKSYEGQKQAFNEQLNNTLAILGQGLVGPATEALKSINSALAGFVSILSKHPTGVKIFVEGLAAVTAALFVAGIVALGSALLALGGAAAGITAAAVAIGTLVGLNWGSIGPAIIEALKTVAQHAAGGIPGVFLGIGIAIVNALKGAAQAAIASIPGVFAGIGAAIFSALKGAITSILPGGKGDSSTQDFGRALGGAGAAPMRYNAAPPQKGSGGSGVTTANLIVDGRKLGQVVMKNAVRSANGPTEGSVYPDATRTILRNDTSYVV